MVFLDEKQMTTMTSATRHLLGMLTPSSNTVLEPMTAAMLSGIANVSAHFGRFRVTEISLDRRALQQFHNEPMLAASDLLADARVRCICWNGASAGWLGFERDEALCAAITERTGILACSSVLALNEIFERTRVRRFGLVTPYVDAIQSKIIENYRAHGYQCTSERHLGEHVNFAFSEVSEETLEEILREVAQEGQPDAIVIFCTNLRGAAIASKMEEELGIPVYDMVQTAVWKSFIVAGADPADVKGWGQLFQALS